MATHPCARGRSAALLAQRGQVLPLCLLVVSLAAVVAVALVHLGDAAARRSRAQAAADAAALAGADAGRGAARAAAEANGARLVRFQRLGDDVLVEVARAGVRASARARWVVARRVPRGPPRRWWRCWPRPAIP